MRRPRASGRPPPPALRQLVLAEPVGVQPVQVPVPPTRLHQLLPEPRPEAQAAVRQTLPARGRHLPEQEQPPMVERAVSKNLSHRLRLSRWQGFVFSATPNNSPGAPRHCRLLPPRWVHPHRGLVGNAVRVRVRPRKSQSEHAERLQVGLLQEEKGQTR